MSNIMNYVFVFVAASLFLTSEAVHTNAEQKSDKCVGILHKDEYGIKLAGGTEDICIIRKADEKRILAVCTIGKYCEVSGLVDLCKDSGECVEITNIISVRANDSFLLPSQNAPNFYNARMCRDHQVLSALLTAAKSMLQTRVTIAGSDGPTTAYDPDDIRLEAVSVLPDNKGAIFCSVGL